MPNLKDGLPKAGDIREVYKKFGKEMIEQDFKMIDGTTEEFVIMRVRKDPIASIIFPVTQNMEVVSIRQFRYAAIETLIEIPGGNPKGDQTPEETLMDELMEETGYRPEKILWLGNGCKLWFEPVSVRARYVPLLALGCVWVKEPTLEKNEYMETELVPLPEWIHMTQSGLITDDKTITVTHLALQHLGYKILKA